MATSTFLARQRACMFDSSPLTPIKRFCRCSQRRWAKGREKQLALLSRQNGFHHSVHIAPLICLLHAGEEPGRRRRRLFSLLSACQSYWNEMRRLKTRAISDSLFYFFIFSCFLPSFTLPPSFHLKQGGTSQKNVLFCNNCGGSSPTKSLRTERKAKKLKRDRTKKKKKSESICLADRVATQL